MLKIAVCDDEQTAAKEIDRIVRDFTERENIGSTTEVFLSGETLLSSKLDFDIVFLDIEFSGINGIEIGAQLKKNNPKILIIYVTSHADFTHRAFDVHAFGYIVKPISEEKLIASLGDCITLLKSLQREQILFSTGKSILRIEISDIMYFEYESKGKIKLVTREKIHYLPTSLTALHKKLSQWPSFAVAHKGFIVNMLNINSIEKCDITMANGDYIPIAQKQVSSFKKVFNAFMQKTFEII